MSPWVMSPSWRRGPWVLAGSKSRGENTFSFPVCQYRRGNGKREAFLETKRSLPSDPWKRAADRFRERLKTKPLNSSMARESVRAGDSLRNCPVDRIAEWLGRNVLFFVALTDREYFCVTKQRWAEKNTHAKITPSTFSLLGSWRYGHRNKKFWFSRPCLR